MGVTSVIQSGLHAPPKIDTGGLSRSPSISTYLRSKDYNRVQFFHNPLRILTVGNSTRVRNLPIGFSKSTKEEDGISTKPENRTSKKPADATASSSKSHLSASRGRSEVENDESERFGSAVRTVAFWVCTAVVFGIGIGFNEGAGKASEFFAGYLLEQSLSVDNLFVFVLIFKYFKVPMNYQSQVLSYGIAGAVIFRLSLILLGTATIQRFEAVNLFLAAILLYSSFKLFAEDEEEEDLSNNFVVRTCQKFIPVTASYDGNKFFTLHDGVWKATPLLLTTAVIELSDIVFAVDSIPAVFGVTLDPFIVFSSNIFAILGLRSLYTIISESMSELDYLQPSIAVVLGFIGCKMILDFFGYHVSTEASLGIVATSLTVGVVLSLWKKSD